MHLLYLGDYKHMSSSLLSLFRSIIRKQTINQMWWSMPEILALGKLRQKDHKFKDSLGYIIGSRTACTMRSMKGMEGRKEGRKKERKESKF
jgi:hypothetical protein